MTKPRPRVPVVCFGDSLTAGGPPAKTGRWPTGLQRLLGRSQPGHFEVYNRGLAGNTSAQGLDRFAQDVLPLLPGWVIVAFGINDCNVRPDRQTPRVGASEFGSNLREIVRMVRAVDGIPVLLSPHYPEPDRRTDGTRKYDQGNGSTYAENFRAHHHAIRRVARRCCVPLIDLPRLIARTGVGTAGLLADDGVHLTTEGNRFYAEQVWRQLDASIVPTPPSGPHPPKSKREMILARE